MVRQVKKKTDETEGNTFLIASRFLFLFFISVQFFNLIFRLEESYQYTCPV